MSKVAIPIISCSCDEQKLKKLFHLEHSHIRNDDDFDDDEDDSDDDENNSDDDEDDSDDTIVIAIPEELESLPLKLYQFEEDISQKGL